MKDDWRAPLQTGVLVLLALTLATELFTLSDDRLIDSANRASLAKVAGISPCARGAQERVADEIGNDWLTGDLLGSGEEDPLDRMAEELLGELIVTARAPQTCGCGGNEAPGGEGPCACCTEQNETGPKTPTTVTARLGPALGRWP